MSPEQLKERLQKVYSDGQIEVVDLTGTQDHYLVKVASEAFAGLTRIARHRAVMDVFDQELKTGEIHALTIEAKEKI